MSYLENDKMMKLDQTIYFKKKMYDIMDCDESEKVIKITSGKWATRSITYHSDGSQTVSFRYDDPSKKVEIFTYDKLFTEPDPPPITMTGREMIQKAEQFFKDEHKKSSKPLAIEWKK